MSELNIFRKQFETVPDTVDKAWCETFQEKYTKRSSSSESVHNHSVALTTNESASIFVTLDPSSLKLSEAICEGLTISGEILYILCIQREGSVWPPGNYFALRDVSFELEYESVGAAKNALVPTSAVLDGQVEVKPSVFTA